MQRYFIIVIVIVAGLSAAIYIFWRQTNQPASFSIDGAQISPVSQRAVVPLEAALIPPEERLHLGTTRGTVITNNFYKTAEGFDGDALVFFSSPQYQLLYDIENSAFGIYIVGSELTKTRAAAEKEFLVQLGISQADACKLNVSVSVPRSTSAPPERETRSLSYCF